MAQGSHVWKDEYLPLAVEAGCVAMWAWRVDTNKFAMDDRGFQLWGMDVADEVTFEEMSLRIHPVDRDRVRAAHARRNRN